MLGAKTIHPNARDSKQADQLQNIIPKHDGKWQWWKWQATRAGLPTKTLGNGAASRNNIRGRLGCDREPEARVDLATDRIRSGS